MNAIVNVAIIASLSDIDVSKKKVAKVIALNNHNGIKNVVIAAVGIFAIGIWKWAYFVDLL